MELNYKEVGAGKPLIILHGLFGSLDNWITIARKLETKRRVYLVDQRNHGHSPHSDVFTYEAMADDLKAFADSHHLIDFELLGHSMGGKTAMVFATQFPDFVEKLIVVDIAPRYYPVHHGTIINGLRSINLASLTSRNEADEILQKSIPDFGVRQFLLKNLKRTAEGFDWKINLDVIERDIEEVGKALPDASVYDGPTLFIRGELSDYVHEDDMTLIHRHFPEARLRTVKGAGHWVHAEEPASFFDEIIHFIGS